jgi:exosome complex component RRP42
MVCDLVYFTFGNYVDRSGPAFFSSAAALSSLEKDPSIPLTDFLISLFAPLASHPQLLIIPHKKAWSVELDVEVFSADGGNIYDIVVLAVRAALWDLRIPRTKGVGHLLPQGTRTDDAFDSVGEGTEGLGIETFLRGRQGPNASTVDFELESYWDDGIPLEGREIRPIAVTLNLVRRGQSNVVLQQLVLIGGENR